MYVICHVGTMEELSVLLTWAISNPCKVIYNPWKLVDVLARQADLWVPGNSGLSQDRNKKNRSFMAFNLVEDYYMWTKERIRQARMSAEQHRGKRVRLVRSPSGERWSKKRWILWHPCGERTDLIITLVYKQCCSTQNTCWISFAS